MECKTKNQWVRKVIHCKICNLQKFGHTEKFYRDKTESVLKMRHKIIWDFEIETDPPVMIWRSDQLFINMKKRT